MKIKTPDLIGPALAWAVAIARGYKPSVYGTDSIRVETDLGGVIAPFMPHFRWRHGGPIVDEMLAAGAIIEEGYVVIPAVTTRGGQGRGPTTLVAAMRCFVASKLGDEVDVPNELARAGVTS